MSGWVGVRRSFLLPSLALPLALGACGDSTGSDDESDDEVGESDTGEAPLPQLPADLCLTPLAVDEPLCNASLAASPWAISHRGSYAQASSASPAPAPGASLSVDRAEVTGIPVIMTVSAAYEGGERAIWAGVQGLETAIVKLDGESFGVVDLYAPAEREENPPVVPLGVTGAYTLIDAAGHFVVSRANFVSFYADAEAGVADSGIALAGRVFLPESWLCSPEDVIAGVGLRYDGALVLVTEQGQVILTRGGPEGFDEAATQVFAINGDSCGASPDPDELEIVSNNIAIDERGGIFVVSSEAMYRFDEVDGALGQTWRTTYEAEGNTSPVRLGPGSGSTPSLMGTRVDEDRFVVLTDGQELMHLVLMWADEIPADWEPIGPDKDPRIACEVPIRFGDPSATVSVSEQSVLVRGHAAVVVNNLVDEPTIVEGIAAVQNLVTALESGQADKAPKGIERIDWDPATRTCSTVWANPDISVPNGIPTMSAATGLIYGVGKRDGAWGIEGIDFATGESRLWGASDTECDGDLSAFGPLAGVPALIEAVEADPQFCENSLYAATTVGIDGAIYTGTLGGLTRYSPDATLTLEASAQAGAGVDQAIDLLARVADSPAEAEGGALSQLELIQRALRQLLEVQTLAALDEAGDASVAAAIEQLAIALAEDTALADRDAAVAEALALLQS